MPGQQPRLYECSVLSVRAKDRVLDAQSSRSGTRFTNVSYLLPYINSGGSGFDMVPRVGSQCLILATDRAGFGARGRFSVVIGFKSPVTKGAGLELGGRLADLTEGSLAMRTLDEEGNEAKVICFHGGTVLIGSGDSARTVYSPINSTIAHLFNNWEMTGPGGFVNWVREVGGDDVIYDAEFRVKADPDTPGMRVRVRIGTTGNDPVVLEVARDSGVKPEHPPLRLRVNAAGETFVEGDVINIIGLSGVSIDAPNVVIKGRSVLSEKDPI